MSGIDISGIPQEELLRNAIRKKLVRGCVGSNIAVPHTGVEGDPISTTGAGGICSYNVNQTPHSSETVNADEGKSQWWARGFYGRQGSQDNKHADYFITGCTKRGPDSEFGGGVNIDQDCNWDGLTVDGYTATINCATKFDEGGMEKVLNANQGTAWSTQSFSELEDDGTDGADAGGVAGATGAGMLVGGPIGAVVGGIGYAAATGGGTYPAIQRKNMPNMKVMYLPMMKGQSNSSDKMSYDCSNRKVGAAPSEHSDAPAETYRDRCSTGMNANPTGGSGPGAKQTLDKDLRDKCNTDKFTLQTSCGPAGLMMTVGFRDPRLHAGIDKDDHTKLSSDDHQSIGWKDVKESNEKLCCLGAGSFIQSRRPMGERCKTHKDCLHYTVNAEGELEDTHIRCFSDEDPSKFVEDGKTGTCRRAKLQGGKTCIDRVDFESTYRTANKNTTKTKEVCSNCFNRLVFRSKYHPSNYGKVVGGAGDAVDQGKCRYEIPREQTDQEKLESSNPKRLEIEGNDRPHPRTCDPNWSPYYNANFMDIKAWANQCAPHYETFCKENVTENGQSIPRWQADGHLGKICRGWVQGKQTSGGDLSDDAVVITKGENATKFGIGKFATDNAMLQHWCAKERVDDSLIENMLDFCNGRVQHDAVDPESKITERCNAKLGGTPPPHCPRWKTEKWGTTDGFCTNLAAAYPRGYDDKIWDYCTMPYSAVTVKADGKVVSGPHQYDEACDCLAGEIVDPNAQKFNPSKDLRRCKKPVGGKPNRVIQDDARFYQRQFRCSSMLGNRMTAIQKQNRAWWMDSCNRGNQSLKSTILMPKNKWQQEKNTPSCDLDPETVVTDDAQVCNFKEYECQPQQDPCSGVNKCCFNIIDIREQFCVNVGSGTCTKLENINMSNTCPGGDGAAVQEQQLSCLQKDCGGTPCTFRSVPTLMTTHTTSAVANNASITEPVTCSTVSDCPECQGTDCTAQCVNGKCYSIKPECTSQEVRQDQEAVETARASSVCGCDVGSGWNRELNKCVPGVVTLPEDIIHCTNYRSIRQRAWDAACLCEPGKGYDPASKQCVEGVATTGATAVACGSSVDIQRKKQNLECCDSAEKGWNLDASSVMTAGNQYDARVCSTDIQTSSVSARMCEKMKNEAKNKQVELNRDYNKECCDQQTYGWKPLSSMLITGAKEERQCLLGIQTDKETAQKCAGENERLRKEKERSAMANMYCCGDKSLGWNPKVSFDAEYGGRVCTPHIQTSDETAARCAMVWKMKEGIICASPLMAGIVLTVVFLLMKKKRSYDFTVLGAILALGLTGAMYIQKKSVYSMTSKTKQYAVYGGSALAGTVLIALIVFYIIHFVKQNKTPSK